MSRKRKYWTKYSNKGNTKTPRRCPCHCRAAENGHAKAQLELGIYYCRGVPPVPQNERIGLNWLRKAKEQGYSMNIPPDLNLKL